MPEIRPLSDLRNNIGEITQIVDDDKMPVFLTKHGKGKYVLISMDEYDRLSSANELYLLIDEGIAAAESGKVKDFNSFMTEFRKEKNR